MPKIIFLSLFIVFLVDLGIAQQSLSIVPFPKTVDFGNGYFELKPGLEIGYDNNLADAAKLLKNDLYILHRIESKCKKGKATVKLELDDSFETEEYTLEIAKGKIEIIGGSYNAVSFGITSILQLIKEQNNKFQLPVCKIADKPSFGYRGVSLDVARQWHNIETVKQVVELCRWYKIRYMQFHFTDDQSFTFPSTAYPKLASKNRHYTLDELKDLVEFAKQRGVTIIPEFDAPGHTSAMRKAMPELFGESGLGVINMADEKVYTAMETIMKEMMDVFYTSPYFHIGADEAWLGSFEKTEAAKNYVKKMGFDNVHDIYLNFIVRMHKFVKSQGKKTLVWESFQETGSNKVQIPKDMLVFAWETAYQRPESLIANGYQIINASWKPAYVCPGWRWRPEYIYNWNIRKWENHWNATPSYHNPIQLDKNTPIVGGQMCSWEMSEEQQVASLHQRVPAISEEFWNGDDKKEYLDFRKRYIQTDKKYTRLVFPVNIKKTGFTEPDYEGLYFNRENRFCNAATLAPKKLLPDSKLTYTTDGSIPEFGSEECPAKLELKKDTKVKFAVFNKQGNMIGYKTVKYELNAIIPTVAGDMLELRDTNIFRNKIAFTDGINLSFENLKKESSIKYTTDGSTPKINSKEYTSAIKIDKSQTVRAICFYNDKAYGLPYKCQYIKKDFEKNITTGKIATTSVNKDNSGETAKKAVDGFIDIDGYWDNHGGPEDMVIDLEKATNISKIVLYTYWDGHRYYRYSVELSVDGKSWEKVLDRSENKEVANENGYTNEFSTTKARFIKVKMLKNSANPSMHIVEIRAY